MKPLHIFWGKVQRGKNRGKDLGFPTANMRLHKPIPSGIYIAMVTIDQMYHPALTFIGEAKTFNETIFQAETYILDFHKQIYGKWLNIKLLQKLRENKKFPSTNALIVQMQEDEKMAKAFFQDHPLIHFS